MASSSPGASATYLILVVLIVLIARRMAMVMKGSKVSKSRAIGFAIYYVAFAGVFLVSSFLNGVPAYLSPLYVGVGAVAAYGSYRFTDRRIVFWKGPDGSVYMKGAILIYVIYIVGLLTRVSIELYFLGPAAFNFAPRSANLSPTAIDATAATDLLLVFGVGLLLGRTTRTLKRYNLILQGKEQVPDMPSA